VSDKE